jgi:hypothetical protein
MMMWLGIVQKVRVLEKKKGDKIKHGVFFWKRIGVVGTCNKKPQILFWYSTNFKCCFGSFSTKHGTML